MPSSLFCFQSSRGLWTDAIPGDYKSASKFMSHQNVFCWVLLSWFSVCVFYSWGVETSLILRQRTHVTCLKFWAALYCTYCSRITADGRLRSNCSNPWANHCHRGLSRAHTQSEGHSTACCTINWIYFIARIKVLIYIMVAAKLYVTQNTEDNKSFLWRKQLDCNITAIVQMWVNTYVNPADQNRILCLSFCCNELVFLHVFRQKARTSFLYSYIPCDK